LRVLKEVPSFEVIKQENPNLKALIFVMDGTLLNTEPLHAIIHKELAQEYAPDKSFTNEQMLEDFKGLADNLIYDEFIKRNIITDSTTCAAFIEIKNNIMLKEIPEMRLNAIFNDKILTLIHEATKQGYPVSICTASQRELTHTLLQTFDLFKLFKLIKTNEDFSRSKPDPEPYISTINELQLQADDVVIFEDSIAGIQSAKSTKAPMYKVEWY
jgi:beta-phosphoglucomutase